MRCTLAICLFVTTSPSVVQGQSPHPIVGTWNVNLERTTFEPAPRILTATYQYAVTDDGFIIHTISRVRPDGTPGFVQIAFKLDGMDYPYYTETSLARFLTTGAPSTVTQSHRTTGPSTIEQTTTSGTTRTFVVSADGQTMMMSATGDDFTAAVAFDRVR